MHSPLLWLLSFILLPMWIGLSLGALTNPGLSFPAARRTVFAFITTEGARSGKKISKWETVSLWQPFVATHLNQAEFDYVYNVSGCCPHPRCSSFSFSFPLSLFLSPLPLSLSLAVLAARSESADMPALASWQDARNRGDLWENKEDLQLMPVSARLGDLLRSSPTVTCFTVAPFPSPRRND